MDENKIKKFRELALQQGYKASEIDKLITAKRDEAATLDLVQKGVIDVADVAKDNPQLAIKATESGVKAKLSAEEQKRAEAAGSVMNLIDTLEENYQESGAGSTNLGVLSRLFGLGTDVSGKLGANTEANVFQKQREGFIATLKGLTGDTGVMTEQDAKR